MTDFITGFFELGPSSTAARQTFSASEKMRFS